MSTSNYCQGATRWLWIGCLVALAILLLPATALALSSNPDSEGPELCAQCHPQQVAIWGDSPHSQSSANGATCTTCHGAYVSSHPQAGLMQVNATASCCQDCHATTYEQWHETGHSGVGVECASCHVPHSQETRLAGEELCESCHRDEAEHWVHHEADVHCVDCHVYVPADSTDGTDVRVGTAAAAPNHSFRQAAEACVLCHGPEIHQQVETGVTTTDRVQLATMAGRARDLAYELKDAQKTNRSLQTMSVVSLGFGLGTGGVLGAIFVLVVGYVAQGRARQ